MRGKHYSSDDKYDQKKTEHFVDQNKNKTISKKGEKEKKQQTTTNQPHFIHNGQKAIPNPKPLFNKTNTVTPINKTFQ